MLDRFLDCKSPNGELPTPAQLFRAAANPAEADPWLVDYLAKHPEYAEYIKRVREFQDSVNGIAGEY